jgi:AhpD family alkylhydroperoxidase
MDQPLYPLADKELPEHRTELAPETEAAFKAFNARVFSDGALSRKTKLLIAVAVAHVTQCPYCIRNNVERVLKLETTEQEIMEAIWVAAEMRAGAAYAHSNLALDAINRFKGQPRKTA